MKVIMDIAGLSLLIAAVSLAQNPAGGSTISAPSQSAPVHAAAKPLPNPRIPEDLEATHDVVIGKGGNKTLHAEILRPKDPAKTPTRAIIYVHGGGWAGGNARFEIPRAYFLAENGYLVVGIEYRLSVEAKWPAQIEDCKLGVRWLRAHAAEYRIDPERIGIMGHSAGGHLAACLGTMNDPKFEGAGGYAGVSSKVQAVVDTSGPVDFTAGNFYDGSDYIPAAQKPKSDAMLLTLFGMPFASNPKAWTDGSPITHVRAGDPPFLIACGEKDPIVSPAQGTRLAAALRAVNVPAELIVIKNANHGLGALPGQPATVPDGKAFRDQVLAFYAKYLK